MDTKIENYVIIAGLKSETIGKLINRIPGSRRFDIKFTRLSFENACLIARQASQCQQAFSKPCLVKLISRHSPSSLYICECERLSESSIVTCHTPFNVLIYIA